MSPSLATAQHALLVLVLFTALISAVTAAAASRVVASASGWPPGVAAGRLRGLVLSPLVGGVAMTAVTFLPSLAASVAGLHHHCTSHPGHPHLCVVHAASGGGGSTGWLLLLAVAIVIVVRLGSVLGELRRGLALVRALPASTTTDGVVAVPSDEPLCAAIGLWAPRIVVSSGFARGVGPEALEVAIAHERAHVRRRDGLWSLAVRIAAVVHGRETARRLRAAVELATERACDEAAAQEVGDRLAVADAILRARRLRLGPGLDVAPAFGPTQWAARVEALLVPAARISPRTARWDVRLAVATALLIAAAGPLHHAAETALALVAH